MLTVIPSRRVAALFGLVLAIVLTSVAPISYAQGPATDEWEPIRNAIDASPITDVVVMVGNEQGTLFVYSKGAFTTTTPAELASASKWLTSGTIMRLVEAGILSLDDHPQDYIDWWTDDPNDPRSQITVEDMLAFKSGFYGEEGTLDCVGNPNITNEHCVRTIYEDWFQYTPGSAFYYSPTHMHILGLMAENATGLSYPDIFRQYLADPLGLSDATGFFDPSASNPRPAGGAISTPDDYFRYVQALFNGDILADSRDLMFQDHAPNPVVIARTAPQIKERGYEWHYAFGAWRECNGVWTTTCAEQTLISSGGAYGWLPWIDLDNGYFALIAQRGRLLSGPFEQSLDLAEAIRPLIVTIVNGGNTPTTTETDSTTAPLPSSVDGSLYQNEMGSYTVAHQDIIIVDAPRDREIALRVNYPAEEGQYPLILFSHSWRTSNEWYRPLVDFWVSHGYIVFQPNHLDSTAAEELMPDNEAVSRWQERPQDLSFILDSLSEIEAQVPQLAGRIDTAHIGVAGHSFGGNTAQLVGGAQPATRADFVDERISAVVIISGWGTGFFDLDEHSWEQFDNPMMLFAGTNDNSDRTNNTWEWRLEPFELAKPGDKYAVVIEGAYHGFGGITRAGDPGMQMGPANPTHVTYVTSTTLAFWDAYIKAVPEALAYLQSDSVVVASNGEVDLRRR